MMHQTTSCGGPRLGASKSNLTSNGENTTKGNRVRCLPMTERLFKADASQQRDTSYRTLDRTRCGTASVRISR